MQAGLRERHKKSGSMARTVRLVGVWLYRVEPRSSIGGSGRRSEIRRASLAGLAWLNVTRRDFVCALL